MTNSFIDLTKMNNKAVIIRNRICRRCGKNYKTKLKFGFLCKSCITKARNKGNKKKEGRKPRIEETYKDKIELLKKEFNPDG